MMEVELEQLRKTLLGMNTEEQLEVSLLLLDEFRKQNETYEFNNDSYDLERVNKVVYLLNLYVSNLIKNEKREEMLEILKRLDTFPENKKKRVVATALNEVRKIEIEDEQVKAEEDCKKDGHIFEGENEGWTSRSYSIFEKNYLVDYLVLGSWVNHTEWSRKCYRCGIVETILDKEPEAVKKLKKKY